MLCLPGRFSFYEMQPGIHARGFDFTAYLTADYFQKLVDDNTESLAELDHVSTALIDAAKTKMRQHFREREAERSRGKIQEWKDAKIYPYEGQAADPIEVNERQVFDVVALKHPELLLAATRIEKLNAKVEEWRTRHDNLLQSALNQTRKDAMRIAGLEAALAGDSHDRD